MKNVQMPISFCFLLFMAALYSCKHENGYNDPISKDMTKPGVVTNIHVTNYNGGSYIDYDLPNSPNILYVLAKYDIREGTPRETKASYYNDTVNVEGFADSKDYEVTLYTVSRAEVMSDPVTVTVHPDIPVYQLVYQQLNLSPDFGGVEVRTTNLSQKEVGIVFAAFDESTNRLEIQDQHYTKNKDVIYSVRGYQDVPRQFGVFVQDKFGNVSDTLKQTVTPLFEELLDKSLFSAYTLASDVPIGFGWALPNLWDNKTDGSSPGWHGASGTPAPWVCSFDVGKSYQLSRFVMWERPDEYAYNHGNPKFFSIWASNAARPSDAKLPKSAPEGTIVGDWTNIGNFTFPDPPSGNSPTNVNDADKAFVKAGVNFNFSAGSHAAVRFIRLAVNETWSHDDAPHVMELSFYGSSK